MLTRSALAATCALALFAQAAQAAPAIPTRDDEVVERLPIRTASLQRELQSLRAELAARPHDTALAARVAQRYITIARSETDPRYYSYAQAALAPWWTHSAPPVAVRLLRATLLQSSHHFPEALADLDAVVALDPGNAQAWLTRATVQTVRGDYNGATASCARLSALASQLASITCISNVAAMTGRAAKSEVLLDTLLQRSGEADSAMQEWSLTLLAEMAARRGDAASAEARFRKALALDPRDSYVLGAYSDFLLDQKRPQDVLLLVREQTRVDSLLLRYALALQQLPGQATALRAATAELKARYDAALQRGDTVHQREQARFELYLHDDTKAALALARQNWDVQKESADMRILLEAAVRAGDKSAAAPVLDWVAEHGSADQAILRLARQLKGGA